MARFGWAYVNSSGAGSGSEGPNGSVQFSYDETGQTTGSAYLTFYTASVYSYKPNSLILSGNLYVTGTVSASTFHIKDIITIDATGSTDFGDSKDDHHFRTGSFVITTAGGAPSAYTLSASVVDSRVHVAGLNFADDKTLIFGSNDDWTIEYDEDGDDDLVMTGTTFEMATDTATFTSANATDPLVIIKNTTNDTGCARLRFVKDKGAAGDANDDVGIIQFYGDDANQDQVLFGRIRTRVAVHTDGQEGGKMQFAVASHDGELVAGLTIGDGDAEDEVDVTIANGASSVTTIAGELAVPTKIFHVGDADTFINFTDDDINFQAGGVNFLDLTEDGSQDEITFNEGGVDVDFRVETADESHMIFVEGSSNRMSIGDNTGSPGATLEVKNHASAGAYGVPLVQLNSNDTDEIALDINADNIDANVVDILADAVTTAKVINVSADGLTTGNALRVDDNSSNTGTRQTAIVIQNHASAIAATALAVQSDGGVTGVKIDKNYSDTAEASVVGLDIDFDKTGATTSDNTMYGIQLDMDNTTATNGTNTMYGLHVTPTLTHAADAGTSHVYGALINAQGGTNGSGYVQGARIEAGGGDINYGLQLDVEDGGVDLRIESSADNGDYFQIQTTTHGATTITTVDDNATAADLTFTVDGDIILGPAGGDVLPDGDNTRNLGSAAKRWANIYTGDLHLKNDRGDWTIVEEEDFLCVINNKTGKKFKMNLIPMEDDE